VLQSHTEQNFCRYITQLVMKLWLIFFPWKMTLKESFTIKPCRLLLQFTETVQTPLVYSASIRIHPTEADETAAFWHYCNRRRLLSSSGKCQIPRRAAGSRLPGTVVWTGSWTQTCTADSHDLVVPHSCKKETYKYKIILNWLSMYCIRLYCNFNVRLN